MQLAAAEVHVERNTPCRARHRFSGDACPSRWLSHQSGEMDSLRTLPGKFSGLHLLASMYAALQQIDPTLDTGVDCAAEYEAAMGKEKALPGACVRLRRRCLTVGGPCQSVWAAAPLLAKPFAYQQDD